MQTESQKLIYSHQFAGEAPDPSPLQLADTAPPWRQFSRKPTAAPLATWNPRPMEADQAARGRTYLADETEARMVTTALVLRRPLLVTGQAGVGKTSLAYSVAWQLGLGNVLRWGVTSRSTLRDALYQYDAVARLHAASLHDKGVPDANLDFGNFITLAPLGTALLPTYCRHYFPRVLLIDEIDKSDADLPSDLLHVLEEGGFIIPELARLPESEKEKPIQVKTADPALGKVTVPADGRIRCDDFPLIIMTSNGDRDFPPAFLRRCLQLEILRPSREKLEAIINTHFAEDLKQDKDVLTLLSHFDAQQSKEALLAIDQLLNAIYLIRSGVDISPLQHEAIKVAVFHSLSESPQISET